MAITFAPMPDRICGECQADAPRHWISSMQLYCSHREVLALRLPRTQDWIFYEGVTPKRLSHALATWQPQANRLLETWARAAGTSKEQCDRWFTKNWLAFLDRQQSESPGREHRG